MEGVFRWRRCVGGRGVLVLVEGAFWCSEPFNGWRGRFGGRSILVEAAFWWKEHFGGGGCLVEGAFWWSEPFNGWRGWFGARGDLVEEASWWRNGLVGGVLMDGRGVSVEGMLWTESGCMVPIFCCVFI